MSTANSNNRQAGEPANSAAETPQKSIPPESPGSKAPLDQMDVTPDTELPENTPKTPSLTIDNLLSDIADSNHLNQLIMGSTFEPICDSSTPISSTFSQTADTLKNINSIKDELCKLPLDLCESEYISNNINPLLNVLYQLSTTSYNLSSSQSILAVSSIVHPKRSELKDTIHLCYKINDKCEDVYDVLKKRINFVLKCK